MPEYNLVNDIEFSGTGRDVENAGSTRRFRNTGSDYFFERSFSRPFNSDMNSFTSLKSR